MSARECKEQAGLIWMRWERRRLARAWSAPGRRSSVRVSSRKPWWGGTRGDAERAAVLAVPGLRPRDVEVSTPQRGRVLVRLFGPAASERTAAAVHQALWRRMPVGVELRVEAVVNVEATAWA
ncbi:hypothetical protein WMF30_10255 [Sorangium sp. So ce134]